MTAAMARTKNNERARFQLAVFKTRLALVLMDDGDVVDVCKNVFSTLQVMNLATYN